MPRVENRVAPMNEGWTHIRIEFVEKPHNENILQPSLITVEPDEVPGTSLDCAGIVAKTRIFTDFRACLKMLCAFKKLKTNLN